MLLRICLIIGFLIPSLAWGQTSSKGTISESSTDCSATNGCVKLHLPSSQGFIPGTLSVSIKGTFSATLQFEQSADNGDTWVGANGTPQPSGSPSTATTSTGVWVFDVSSRTDFRVRCSAYTSGTATVTIQSSPASRGVASAGGITDINGAETTTITLDTGTSGTDINYVTNVDTITLNVPDASCVARGVVNLDAQCFKGNKTFEDDVVANTFTASGGAYYWQVPGTSDYLGFISPSSITVSPTVWTLPTEDANGCFKSDGLANMSIASCGGGFPSPNDATSEKSAHETQAECAVGGYVSINDTATANDSFATQNFTFADATSSICYIQMGGGAGLDSSSQVATDSSYNKNTEYILDMSYVRLESVANLRAWIGLTDIEAVNILTEDDPNIATKDLMMFRFSAGTGGGPDPGAGDTHWMCALQQNNGALALTDSGVTPDTNWHKYEVSYDGVGTVTWKIDHITVCTSASSVFTDGQPMWWWNSVTNLSAVEVLWDFGLNYSENVLKVGP